MGCNNCAGESKDELKSGKGSFLAMSGKSSARSLCGQQAFSTPESSDMERNISKVKAIYQYSDKYINATRKI